LSTKNLINCCKNIFSNIAITFCHLHIIRLFFRHFLSHRQLNFSEKLL